MPQRIPKCPRPDCPKSDRIALSEGEKEDVLYCRTCKLTQVVSSARLKKFLRAQIREDRYREMAAANSKRVTYS